MTFVEEGEFFCFCTTWQDRQGVWKPLVFFEQRADRERPTMVVAAHHTVDAEYPSEEAAEQAAIEFAVKKAQTGDVGIP